MDADQVAACARRLIDAARTRAPYERLDGALNDAYEVQRRYVELAQSELGVGRSVGYKIALTSEAMQTLVGVREPLYGHVFETRVLGPDCAVVLGDYQHVGMEFEVAARIGADLPSDRVPYTAESVAESVAGMAAAYELIEDRNADYDAINAFSLVADNCWNAGVVIGEYQLSALSADARTQLWVDGELAGEGRAGDALGHPLNAVAWLANALAGRGLHLRAGDFVMTGSSIRTTFPVAGQHYRFEVAGLEPVSISFS